MLGEGAQSVDDPAREVAETELRRHRESCQGARPVIQGLLGHGPGHDFQSVSSRIHGDEDNISGQRAEPTMESLGGRTRITLEDSYVDRIAQARFLAGLPYGALDVLALPV